MITFDDFRPGHIFGTAPVTLDDALFGKWTALFPDDAACAPDMPEGMIAVLVMNAYMELIAPRPPGNVHAGQTFALERLPKLGETVNTTITCTGKELRKGRRWLTLETRSHDDADNFLFSGEMRLIWAA
ncbi:hypothetical protein AL036_17670 [Salipiger aestuarii]|uniref:Acyl dehydratase n=1 Tax=Salipiger aestuarii TaxID=568098 RepID=A0A327XYY1_9RHOB|nr:hypothetical protein [Salipiger aestuarii]KAA8605733.1 hypothetical protein AL036_17670 [Salipiger aestuarii]KAA8607031.1 hypothetical protein AL037_19495 [Salipiger aestuarii]KAB2539860.1 hypothetical protein AL035_17355 [Salipiger aestuarii]RAK11319.1 hypothetical protein ATI53_104919 [Salipiger aestuarii]